MFGFKFKKASPTVFVMHFKNGRIVRSGPGLSFLYFAPVSSIIDVPLDSKDVPFIFQETTADFQACSFQGQLTYRIADAARVSQLIDFTVDARGEYVSEKNPEELLSQRLINTTQVIARSIVETMLLTEVLRSSDQILAELITRLRSSEPVSRLGVEIVSVSILAIKPTPEMSRALEAESRETLHQRADEAIYARRNNAVEQERKIKESELNTEIAVETKKREIRETQMAADIAVEQQRSALIDTRVENDRKDADSRAYSLSANLKPLENVDWRMLMVLAAKNGDPRFAISLAFQELAENANKIGQLNVTPDLLKSLMQAEK